MERNESRVQEATGLGKRLPEIYKFFPQGADSGVALHIGYCRGRGEVTWEDSILAFPGIETTVFEYSPLGGLSFLLESGECLLYNGAFERIEELPDDPGENVIIAFTQKDIVVFFKETHIGEITVCTLIDISSRLKYLEAIIAENEQDRLTGLFNRASFLKRCRKLLLGGGFGAMAYIDLDNLKNLNDAWGHDTGDRYLVALADWLQSFFEEMPRERRVFSRLSGDEFAVFVGGFESEAERDACVNGFNETPPFALPDGKEGKLSFSTGVARYPEDSTGIDDLLVYSDFAMSLVKRNDKGSIRFFERREHDTFWSLSKGLADLDQIIRERDIFFNYIPYVSSDSGAPAIFDLFPVSSLESLENIERIALIGKHSHRLGELDHLVYELIVEELTLLADLKFDQVVALGYMPQDLLYHGKLEELLWRSNFPSQRLCLVFDSEMRSYYDYMRTIDGINQLGMLFGFRNYTPKTSAVAFEFSPHIVRLSEEFVRDCSANVEMQEEIRTLKSQAKASGFSIVAGHISSAADFEFLKGLGIDLLGGPAVFGDVSRGEIESIARTTLF